MPMFHVPRLAPPPWLVVLLPYSVLAGGGGEAGGEVWEPEEYESSYVEALVLITFLALALAFEKVWHHLDRHVNGSHIPPDASPEDLFKDLMNRAGVEFMILGFLAFCIFVFNTCGGFDSVVKNLHDNGMTLPVTNMEWLHLAEVVHMQLFLGMIIYFAVISRTVRGAVVEIRRWEKLQAQSRAGVAASEHSRLLMGRDLQEYSQWLTIYNSHIVSRCQENPAEFADLFEQLDIDESDHEKLRWLLAERFSLYRYLALNVSDCIRDSIQIHTKTWFLMIVLFVLFALLHRYAHLTMRELMPVFVIAAIIILLAMRAVVWRTQAKLRRRARVPNENRANVELDSVRDASSTDTKAGKRRPLLEQYNAEIIVMRVLQVIMFLISYVLARDLIDVEEWTSDWIRALVFALVLSAILLLLMHWLPKSVPVFLALMSMPPHVDDDNFRVFVDVLIKCTQESEAKLVRSLTSQQRGFLQSNSRLSIQVFAAADHTNDSCSKSDFGAADSDRSTGCEEVSKIITTYDHNIPSELGGAPVERPQAHIGRLLRRGGPDPDAPVDGRGAELGSDLGEVFPPEQELEQTAFRAGGRA